VLLCVAYPTRHCGREQAGPCMMVLLGPPGVSDIGPFAEAERTYATVRPTGLAQGALTCYFSPFGQSQKRAKNYESQKLSNEFNAVP
jgi:hypothetical protein